MSAPAESVDVFDTVLFRRVSPPTAAFRIMGERALARGFVKIPAHEFARQRIEAERACRQGKGAREVILAQIAEELARRLGLPAGAAPALADIELECERELIVCPPLISTWLASLRARAPRLIFLSDMYLPADFLRNQLKSHGCWREGDTLHLSSESGETKASGALYKVVLARESLTAAGLHHHGNHPEADVRTPQRLGITATFRDIGNPNRYERLLESFDDATQGVASIHAGTSRLARLSVACGSPHTEAIRDVAAGVAGPALATYVSWVLRQAREQSLCRLYFVARDGRMLLELARALQPRFCPGVELRYLYGSRHAWHLAGATEFGERELEWLFDDADSLTIARLCERVELEPTTLGAVLEREGFNPAHWTENLSAPDQRTLRDLFRRPEIRDTISRRAASQRDTLLAYLRQEKLLASDHCALVDVGWHGRAQDSLAKVIRSASAQPPAAFYFGLNGGRNDGELGERRAWLFDRRTEKNPLCAFPGIEPLIEMFCTADHGTTLGYAAKGDAIEPVMRATPDALGAWGWATLRDTLMSYAKWLAEAPGLGATSEDAVRKMSAAVLREFWEHPTPLEAEAWGAFPYEDDQTSGETYPLATPLTLSDLPAVLRRGQRGIHRASWWQGSLQLTPDPRRTILATAHDARHAARRIRRAIAS